MILKKRRLSWRLARAGKLVERGRFDDAQALYVSILNALPEEAIALVAHAGLAETEYHRGRLRNARYYAGLCLRQAEEQPALVGEAELEARLRRVREYVDAIEKRGLR